MVPHNIKLALLFLQILVVPYTAPSFVLAFIYGRINTECGRSLHACSKYQRSAIQRLSLSRAGLVNFEFQILESMSLARRPGTQLHMGLLKFFRKGREIRNDDDNISDDLGQPELATESEGDDINIDDDSDAPKISLNTQLLTPSPPYSQRRETVRQRMNRIVSGEMTSDEKEAFLNTALGRIGSNKNKNTAKIRQTLPLASAQKEGTTASLSSPSASSHSAEVSWSSVVSRKRLEQQQRNGDDDGRSIMKIELDGDEAAKQAWLNMVTSPTRFQSYTVLNKHNKTTTATYDKGLPLPAAADESFDIQQSSKQQKQLQDLSDAKKRIQEQQTLFEQMAANSGETSLDTSPFLPKTTFTSAVVSNNKKNTSSSEDETHSTMTNTKNITTISEDGRKDLASRLEEAAVLQEQRDAEVRAALARQREETEQARVEQQRKMAEMARQREEEFRRLEEERLKKKREEEAQRIALEEEKRKIEEAKRKELEAAQDAYWKNKLAQERKVKESRTAPKEKDDSRRGEALNDTTEILKRKIRSIQNDDNVVKYGFTEMGLLEKSEAHRKEAKEAARNIIDSTAIFVAEEELHTSNMSSFGETFNIAEQNAKMDALKKLQQEQQKQLRSLNSLPGHKGTSGLQPLIATTPSRPSSSTTTIPEEQQQQLPKVDVFNAVENRSFTVGDVLSGKVDAESVDVNQLIEERLAANNEDNQILKKPIRQKLMLDDIDLNESPSVRPPSSGTLTSITPNDTAKKNREVGWNMSEEDKKKANKWGINLDRLL